MCGLILILEI